MTHIDLDRVSGDEKELIAMMIEKDITKRISVEDIFHRYSMKYNLINIKTVDVYTSYPYQYNVNLCLFSLINDISLKTLKHTMKIMSNVYMILKDKYDMRDIIRASLLISSKIFDEIDYMKLEEFYLSVENIYVVIQLEKYILKLLSYKIPV